MIVFVGVLLLSAFVVYFIGGGRTCESGIASGRVSNNRMQCSECQDGPALHPRPSNFRQRNFIDRMFGSSHVKHFVSGDHWLETMGRLFFRLLLAALLGAALAFRPRKRILALKRNPYVSQTQILLAIVAAALMIIVGDNAARAFGIFAAVSLVRFQHQHSRSQRDYSSSDQSGAGTCFRSWSLGSRARFGVVLAPGALAVGVARTGTGVSLDGIESDDYERGLDTKALRDVFKKHGFDKELRAMDREATEESPGSIVYSVDVSPTISTDEISADILAIDGQNVQGIEWDQKKSYSYLYQ